MERIRPHSRYLPKGWKKRNPFFRKQGWIEAMKRTLDVIVEDIMAKEGISKKEAIETLKQENFRPTRAFAFEGKRRTHVYSLQLNLAQGLFFCVKTVKKGSGGALGIPKQDSFIAKTFRGHI